MRVSDAIERVLAATSRGELMNAITASAGEVAAADGVRIAELQLAPKVAYRVVGQRLPAPDPSPTIVRSPLSHPIVAEYARTRFRGWVSMQDLLPGRAWLHHPLYREVYRPLGLYAHISCAVRDTGTVMYSLSLNRAGRDFSAHERDQLDQYRRLVSVAWRQVDEHEAVRATLAALDDDTDQAAVLVFTPDPVQPRLVYSSEAMTRLLATEPGVSDAIQAAVAARSSLPARLASGRALRMTVARSANAVVVRAFAPSNAALTEREHQVLRALAHGATAHAIGHQLGISERTVGKHLENIYAKLGVHDRLDAALLARSLGIS